MGKRSRRFSTGRSESVRSPALPSRSRVRSQSADRLFLQRGTTDAAASDALLRKYWFYANDLRDRLFEHISAIPADWTRNFAAIKSASPANPATQQFVAEGCALEIAFLKRPHLSCKR